MIEVILFESKHFTRILMVVIEPFKVFLFITERLCVRIGYIRLSPSLFYDLISQVRIVICLRGRILRIKCLIDLECVSYFSNNKRHELNLNLYSR